MLVTPYRFVVLVSRPEMIFHAISFKRPVTCFWIGRRGNARERRPRLLQYGPCELDIVF